MQGGEGAAWLVQVSARVCNESGSANVTELQEETASI